MKIIPFMSVAQLEDAAHWAAAGRRCWNVQENEYMLIWINDIPHLAYSRPNYKVWSYKHIKLGEYK